MEITDLIGNYAFPVTVAVWLLYERYTMMKALQLAVEQNSQAISRLLDFLQR